MYICTTPYTTYVTYPSFILVIWCDGVEIDTCGILVNIMRMTSQDTFTLGLRLHKKKALLAEPRACL